MTTAITQDWVQRADALLTALENVAGAFSLSPDGTATLPGIAFANEPGTGFSRPAAGALSTSIQGVEVARVTAARIALYAAALDQARAESVSAAATVNLGAAAGNYVPITGSASITSFGTAQAGAQRLLRFDGAATLVHDPAKIILPGGADITTAAGDLALVVSEGGGLWRCGGFWPAAALYLRVDGDASATTVVDSVSETQRSLSDWIGGFALAGIGSVDIPSVTVPAWVTAFRTPVRDLTKPEKGGGATWAEVADDGRPLLAWETRDAGGRRWAIVDTLPTEGQTSEGDFVPGLPQFLTSNLNENVANRYKLHANIGGRGPCLEAVGSDTSITSNYAAGGLGGHLFGNAAGQQFEIVDGGGGPTFFWFQARGGGYGSYRPRLSSPVGAEYDVGSGNAHRLLIGGLEAFRVEQSGSGTPRRLVARLSSGGVEVLPEPASGSDSSLTLSQAGTGYVNVTRARMFGSEVRANYQPSGAASGSTVSWPSTASTLVMVNGSALASLTVQLPSDPADGEVKRFVSQGGVTSLTISAGASPAGTVVYGAPTTLGAASPLEFLYLAGVYNRWIRI